MGTSYTTIRKNHAIHNLEVYDHLKEETEFTDWTITTAFYSALHGVESYLFPYEDWDETVYDNIEEFHQQTQFTSKHKTRDQLIKASCNEIFNDYRRLSELCWKARYEQYEFDMSDLVIEDIDTRLNRIFDTLSIN